MEEVKALTDKAIFEHLRETGLSCFEEGKVLENGKAELVVGRKAGRQPSPPYYFNLYLLGSPKSNASIITVSLGKGQESLPMLFPITRRLVNNAKFGIRLVTPKEGEAHSIRVLKEKTGVDPEVEKLKEGARVQWMSFDYNDLDQFIKIIGIVLSPLFQKKVRLVAKTKGVAKDITKAIARARDIGQVYIYGKDKKPLDVSEVHWKTTLLKSSEKIPEAFRKLPETTRVSKALIDQKFSTRESVEQLALLPFISRSKKEKVAEALATGFEKMDFSLEEDKLLFGICNLLTAGNYKSREIRLKSLTPLYHACQLERTATRRGKQELSGREKGKIDKALRDIPRRNYDFIYPKKISVDPKTGKNIFDIIITQEPIIKTFWLYRNIEEGSLIKLTQSPDKLDKREKSLKDHFEEVLIQVHPVFYESIKNYFREIDAGLYLELKKYRMVKYTKRVSKYEPEFIFWLHKHDKPRGGKQRGANRLATLKRKGEKDWEETEGKVDGEDKVIALRVPIDRMKLAKQIKDLRNYLPKYKKAIRDILLRCYDTAKGCGYLYEYKLDQPSASGGELDIFYLNPEKFSHLRMGKRRLK